MVADLSIVAWTGGRHELPDGANHSGKLLVVPAPAGIQFAELGGKGLVIDEELAETDESADDLNAHGRGDVAVEDIGGSNRAVLGEGVGQVATTAAAGL